MLRNGIFTEGWCDLDPAPGNLTNQEPNSPHDENLQNAIKWALAYHFEGATG